MGKPGTRQPATERVSYTEPSEGFWTIPTESGFWQLSRQLIPAMTQGESAKYVSEKGFHALSVEEVFAIAGSLYDLRNTEGAVEDARNFLRQSMRDNSLLTQTRVIYTPYGKDRVIQSYGTKPIVERRADLVGKDGLVTDVLSVAASRALTGKTPEKVSELMDYLNGTPAYVWRVNSKPSSTDERVVRFGASSDWAYLICYGGLSGSDASLAGKFF